MKNSFKLNLFSTSFAVVLVTIVHSLPTQAQNMQFPIRQPQDRFLTLLDRIDQDVKRVGLQAPAEQRIEQYDSGSLRSSLTSLQNIIRIYKDKKEGKRYSDLKPFYEHAKSFEDHISHLRDLKYFASAASTPEMKEKFNRELEEEKKSYMDFVTHGIWFKNPDTPTEELRKTIQRIQWQSLEKDRNLILTRIAKRMEAEHKKEYDLHDVEEGMHELKRDARRFTYLNNSVGNLITRSGQVSCPLNQEVQRPSVRAQQSYNCEVSECLLNTLGQAEGDIESIKQQGLRNYIEGKPIPPEVVAKAKTILDKLKSSQVYLHLASQLKSCRTQNQDNDHEDREAEENNNDDN